MIQAQAQCIHEVGLIFTMFMMFRPTMIHLSQWSTVLMQLHVRWVWKSYEIGPICVTVLGLQSCTFRPICAAKCQLVSSLYTTILSLDLFLDHFVTYWWYHAFDVLHQRRRFYITHTIIDHASILYGHAWIDTRQALCQKCDVARSADLRDHDQLFNVCKQIDGIQTKQKNRGSFTEKNQLI